MKKPEGFPFGSPLFMRQQSIIGLFMKALLRRVIKQRIGKYWGRTTISLSSNAAVLFQYFHTNVVYYEHVKTIRPWYGPCRCHK